MRILLELLAGLGGLSIAWGALGSARIVRQVRYQPPLRPSDFHLPAENLTLVTSDGIRIAALLVRHPRPTGLLLLLHGYGAAKEDLLDVARAMREKSSFHLILLDLRGHGASGGSEISFGHREVRDVRAVLDYVAGSPDLQGLPVGCYGISMGGAVALLSAARFPEIRAVVVDSAYADLGNAIARTQWLTYHIPRALLGQTAIWGTELRLGCRLRELSPVRVIGKIAPRPVFVIHGMKDETIPADEGSALFAAAREPKELWLVPGAEHVASFYKEVQEYPRRVAEFFRNAFARSA